MTGNEVAAVLGLLSANWPYVEVTENTGRVWAVELAGVHAEDGLAAARMLIRTSERFPSLAAFLAACRPMSAKRAQAAQQADYERKALETETATRFGRSPREFAVAAGVPPADVVDGLEPPPGWSGVGVWPSTKAHIARNAKRQHDHHGPDPCPVCGGMNPNAKKADA